MPAFRTAVLEDLLDALPGTVMDEYTLIEEVLISTSRWEERRMLIFEWDGDGPYGVEFVRGLTEMQEHRLFEDVEYYGTDGESYVDVDEVERVPVTTYTWRKIPPGSDRKLDS